MTRSRSATSRRRPSCGCPIRRACSLARRAVQALARGHRSGALSPVPRRPRPTCSIALQADLPQPSCRTRKSLAPRARVRHAAARPRPLHRPIRVSRRRSTGCSRSPRRSTCRPRRPRRSRGVAGAGDVARDAMVRSVLDVSIPVEALAEHAFVAAALQVHFARPRRAPRRRTRSSRSATASARPAASPPAASMVVGWLGAHGARYCGCACAERCGTMSASNAPSAARPRASPTRRSKAARAR